MSVEIPDFQDMEEARYAWRDERLARDGWIERTAAAERMARVYKEMLDSILMQVAKRQLPEIEPYCTKHSLYHGQKSASCRVLEKEKED